MNNGQWGFSVGYCTLNGSIISCNKQCVIHNILLICRFFLIKSEMATEQCICLALTFPSLFTMLLLLADFPVFNVSRIIFSLAPGSLFLIMEKQVLASPVTQTSDISRKI